MKNPQISLVGFFFSPFTKSTAENLAIGVEEGAVQIECGG